MEHEGDSYADGSCVWNRLQRIGKKRGGIENQKNRDHPDHSSVKIGKSSEKCPGDLKKLALVQTPVKDYQLTLV